MGWTGRGWVSPEAARRAELEGCNILAKSGSWYVVEPGDSALAKGATWKVLLCHVLTQSDKSMDDPVRGLKGYMTKVVESRVGPNDAAPEGLLRKYLKLCAERGVELDEMFEVPWIAKCEHVYAMRKALVDGAVFEVPEALKWSDGVTETRFVYRSKKWFRAGDGRRVGGMTRHVPSMTPVAA